MLARDLKLAWGAVSLQLHIFGFVERWDEPPQSLRASSVIVMDEYPIIEARKGRKQECGKALA